MTFSRKYASALLAGGAVVAFAWFAAAQESKPADAKPAADAAAATAALDAEYVEASKLLPDGAKPGECYARVFIPGTEKQVERKVLVKEESEKLEITPAKFETADETVEVQSASEQLELVEAKFETREKTVVVEPEREEQTSEPPVYEEVEEKIKIREAYTAWKKGEGPIQKYDEATGEIMCLVTIPAEYQTVKKQVVKTPARVVTKTVPAKTKTIQTKVMVEPPTTKKIEIPARFETIKVQKLVEPAKVEKVAIPAEYSSFKETVKESNGRMEWRPILCATNTTPDVVKRIQLALQDQGYKFKAIDGSLGPATMQVVKQYQKDKGLAQGQITIELLDALGVKTGAPTN